MVRCIVVLLPECDVVKFGGWLGWSGTDRVAGRVGVAYGKAFKFLACKVTYLGTLGTDCTRSITSKLVTNCTLLYLSHMHNVRARSFSLFNSIVFFKPRIIHPLVCIPLSIIPSVQLFPIQRKHQSSSTKMAKKTAPYGTWSSPITTEIVSGSTLTFSEVHTNVSDPRIYMFIVIRSLQLSASHRSHLSC